MKININGEIHNFDLDNISIATLVKNLNLDTDKIAIEKNLEIVPYNLYNDVFVTEQDKLEIVQFVGGG